MTGERHRPGSRPAAAVALGLALAVVAVAAAVVPTGTAAADPLDDAKARVAATRDAADAATVRYHDAQTRHAEIVLAIEEVEGAIRSGRQQAAVLRDEVRRVAVTAYTSSGNALPFAGLGSDEPLTAARRQKLLAGAAGVDSTAVDRLAALLDELDRRKVELDGQRADVETALAAVEAEATELQQELATAQEAQAQVEEEIRRLEAARQEAERRRLEAEEAARREAVAASAPEPPADVPVQAGALVCPVRGAVSFVDSWGAPRPQGRHMGVDLMAPRGAVNVAVVSGEVTMRSPGGLPGLGVHLNGDDGNLYYYFHLDSYEGGSRRVAQGEVIGYTGNTGDASGGPTHTHFEVHPGGGGAVNPYPYVAAVC